MSKLSEIYNTVRALPAIETIKGVDSTKEELRFLNCNAKSLEEVLKKAKGLKILYLNNGKSDLLEALADINPTLTGLYLYNFQVKDLKPLERLTKVTYFLMDWNTKATQLWDVSRMKAIKGLSIQQLSKVTSIKQINSENLEELQLSGGMWSRLTIETLEPVASLKKLKHLYLSNIKVAKGGLLSLKTLTGLKELEVSNQFPTREYAELSVYLKNTECDSFSPWIKLEHPIGENDVMVTGKAKPFLNAVKDAERIKKYEDEFKQFQAVTSSGK